MKHIYRVVGLTLFWLLPSAQAQEGDDIYSTRCAACHASPVNEAVRAPARSALEELAPESIYRALTQGVMRIAASGLTNSQMQIVAEYLSGEAMEDLGLE